MKYLKYFENKIVDGILDKINKSGMDSLTNLERSYLKNPTKDIEKQLNGRIYTDEIGPYKATLKLYNIENTTDEFRGVENYSRWNATLEMFVNNVIVKYDGYIMFKDDNYLSSHFESDDIYHSSGDLNTDLEDFEGLQYEADSFFENALYSILNESLLLEGRIDDIEEKYLNRIDKNIVDFFKNNDPTDNKAYFEWMCDRFSKLTEEDKKLFKSDIPVTIVKMINKYNKIKQKLEEKQINKIQSIKELGQILNQDIDMDKLKTLNDTEELKIIYDSFEWVVFIPLTDEASEMGDKAWCTVYNAQEHFKKHFGDYGSLIYFMNKLNNEKNFAMEQTTDGNADVWDIQDNKIIDDEPIEEIDQLLGEIEYLNYRDREGLSSDWEDIVSKIPDAKLTETEMKKIVRESIKQMGIEEISKVYGTNVILEQISNNEQINRSVNLKLVELYKKNPTRYILSDEFFQIVSDSTGESYNDVWSNGYDKKYFTNDILLKYIKGEDESLETRMEKAYNIDTNEVISGAAAELVGKYVDWHSLISVIMLYMDEEHYFSFKPKGI